MGGMMAAGTCQVVAEDSNPGRSVHPMANIGEFWEVIYRVGHGCHTHPSQNQCLRVSPHTAQAFSKVLVRPGNKLP